MSNIQWVECDLVNATHIEINGEVHELKADGNVKKSGLLCSGNFRCIDILIGFNKFEQIHVDLFPFLGIKCLRKAKPTPIEFEATFASYDGNGGWRPMYTLDDGIAYQNFKKAKFKCVEILEEKE